MPMSLCRRVEARDNSGFEPCNEDGRPSESELGLKLGDSEDSVPASDTDKDVEDPGQDDRLDDPGLT